MENQFLIINGLQIVKGDSVEAYIRSIDAHLAQQNSRLRIATATIQQQDQQLKALQRRLASAEDTVIAMATSQRINKAESADVIEVTSLPPQGE